MNVRREHRKRESGGAVSAAAAAAVALITWAVPGLVQVAQAAEKVDPPPAPSPWLEWLLVFAFVGLCCGIAFKNPKRSHQN